MKKLIVPFLMVANIALIITYTNALDEVVTERNSFKVQAAFLKQVHQRKITIDGTLLRLQTHSLEPGAPVDRLYIVTDQTTNRIYFDVNVKGGEVMFKRTENKGVD